MLMNWIVMSEWKASIASWQPLTMQPILTDMHTKFSFLNPIFSIHLFIMTTILQTYFI